MIYTGTAHRMYKRRNNPAIGEMIYVCGFTLNMNQICSRFRNNFTLIVSANTLYSLIFSNKKYLKNAC